MSKPFFVWQNKVLKSVDPANVMCLYTEGNYTKIFLSDESFFLVRSSLAAAQKKLPPEMFIKINRSIVASIYFIDDIARDHLIIKQKPIPIGRQFYQAFIKRLNIIE